ncbi:MAG: hypothetical protein JJE30_01745 [Desulfuromonadales bacterium]|nr:hypothetical protein [Desulfuromonadales bacterium]
MNCTVYKLTILGLLMAMLASLVGCANTSEEAAVPVSAGQAAEMDYGGLATQAGTFLALQAIEQESDSGNPMARKIAYALDPAYKQDQDNKEVNAKLDSILNTLKTISSELNDVSIKLDSLSHQLDIGIADLKLDDSRCAVSQYYYKIRDAYGTLFDPDTPANRNFPQTNDIARAYVKSVMTGSGDRDWHVADRLGLIHQNIVDPSADGLLTKLYNLEVAKYGSKDPQDPTKNLPSTPDEYVEGYLLLERYFAYLQGEQAKGLVVLAASYNYLGIDPFIPSTDLIRPTFDDYLTQEYAPHIERQVQEFLRVVEGYVALVTDVNRKASDLQPWVSKVMYRADLVAAWARASVSKEAPVPLLVFRIVGEPDKVNLLQSVDGPQNKPPKSGSNFGRFELDGSSRGADDTQSGIRSWKARSPYIQFTYDQEEYPWNANNTAAIKGANSLAMTKHVISGQIPLFMAPVQEISVPAYVTDELEKIMNDKDVIFQVSFQSVGPDGSTPGKGDPVLQFGHCTAVLKGNAARWGRWSTIDYQHTQDKLSTDSVTANGITDPPQSIAAYMYAEPTTWNKSFSDGTGGAYTKYYIYGNSELVAGLSVKYYFDGWGDIPSAQRPEATVFGASNVTWGITPRWGSYSVSTILQTTGNDYDIRDNSNSSRLSVAESRGWTPGSYVTFNLETKITAKWDRQSTAQHYGPDPFKVDTTYTVDDLVLHFVKIN